MGHRPSSENGAPQHPARAEPETGGAGANGAFDGAELSRNRAARYQIDCRTNVVMR